MYISADKLLVPTYSTTDVNTLLNRLIRIISARYSVVRRKAMLCEKLPVVIPRHEYKKHLCAMCLSTAAADEKSQESATIQPIGLVWCSDGVTCNRKRGLTTYSIRIGILFEAKTKHTCKSPQWWWLWWQVKLTLCCYILSQWRQCDSWQPSADGRAPAEQAPDGAPVVQAPDGAPAAAVAELTGIVYAVPLRLQAVCGLCHQ